MGGISNIQIWGYIQIWKLEFVLTLLQKYSIKIIKRAKNMEQESYQSIAKLASWNCAIK